MTIQTLYRGDFLLHLQERPEYDGLVLLKEPAHEQLTRAQIAQLHNEHVIARQLAHLPGVRPFYTIEGSESHPVLLLKYIQGQSKLHEPGHGSVGAAVGAVSGGLLGLIGGLVGVLAMAAVGGVVGGVAGHYLGRPINKGDLKELGEKLTPDSSAFLLLLEDIYSEDVVESMAGYNANVVTLTAGSELSGQLATYSEGSVSDAAGDVVAVAGGVVADAEGNVVAGDVVAAAAGDDGDGDGDN